jgi:hypothetical protein
VVKKVDGGYVNNNFQSLPKENPKKIGGKARTTDDIKADGTISR